jgi:SAM-dependent methyltransferase
LTEQTLAKFSQSSNTQGYRLPDTPQDWISIVDAVAARYEREYRREAFEVPPEVEGMPIFRDWATGSLQNRIASPFWELNCPKKNQHWLDLGCGLSFLIYPWRDWGAFFYGLEISSFARDTLQSRGPQLNSKLFQGVELGAAHGQRYNNEQFDGVIATGWSCYYPLDYWQIVFTEIKRILKPNGVLILDVIDLESDLAEDWAILETYLGAEVFLTPLNEWKKAIAQVGGKVTKTSKGELFQMLKVQFGQ